VDDLVVPSIASSPGPGSPNSAGGGDRARLRLRPLHDMKAVHGGKARNDEVDALGIAILLRGGMSPIAYVHLPEMRATRDRLRRRLHLVRRRANLLAHSQSTHPRTAPMPLGQATPARRAAKSDSVAAAGLLRIDLLSSWTAAAEAHHAMPTPRLVSGPCHTAPGKASDARGFGCRQVK